LDKTPKGAGTQVLSTARGVRAFIVCLPLGVLSLPRFETDAKIFFSHFISGQREKKFSVPFNFVLPTKWQKGILSASSQASPSQPEKT
jgi:hypothetical protein